MRIVFVGSALLADGYRMAGVEPIPVTSPEELLSSLPPLLKREDAGIILLDYDLSSKVKDDLDKIRSKHTMPVLIEVPGRHLSADVDLKSTISKIMGVKM